jgi:Kef-type K+ transport system membrane component KefB
MVGMELNPRIIKDLGKSSMIAGFLQVLITSALGFVVGTALGFDTITAIYI